MEKIEGWEETFDILIMSDVVGHLMDIEETFRQLHTLWVVTDKNDHIRL